jgi:DNA-binding transcriptional MerR regulator/ubiquinone/menaquinone biosynthesis C-methylase UbiE
VRIGKFAEDNHLSIDTIRHYMDLSLILPEKQGGQYYFDDRCQKDLEHILELKSMGFTLSEIKIILLYMNFGKHTGYQEDVYYKALFQERFKKLENEIRNLHEIKDRLKLKIDGFSSREELNNFNETGIDLSVLNLLSCSKCGKSLILKDGSINNNQIINGRLNCSCGEEYQIEKGILRVGTSKDRASSGANESYLFEYISVTDSAYLDNLLKGLEWAARKLSGLDLSGKVMLELGTGMGFFLRNVYGDLADDCIYIAVDNNIERHRFLKSMLDRAEHRKNVVFICADFLEIPIKKKLIDILLDISGTSNYSFEHEEFLLNPINHLIKEDATLLGTYILFKNFSSKSLIESKYRKNFMFKNIKESIDKLKFKMIDEKISEYLDKGGKYEDYFIEGEKVYNYSYFGKR